MPTNPRVFRPAGIKPHRDDENASGTMHQKRRTAGVGLLPNLVTASQRAARTASALVAGHGDAVTNGPSPWRTPNAAAPLYGIVMHLPGARCTVAETVITFDSTASAEAFARAQGWTNYQVSPIRFVVDFAVAGPPNCSIQDADTPGVVTNRWDHRGWEVVVQPGADPSAIADAVRSLPEGMRFVESFGDVEVVMLFRPGGPTTEGEGDTCPSGPA